MTENRGFYLISDFHVDMNKLENPSYADGAVLHQPKALRVVKQIYNWLGITPGRTVAFVGDTANAAEPAGMVWQECADRAGRVLAVAGNHEYYMPRYRTLSETDEKLRWVSQIGPLRNSDNITLLEPGRTWMEDGTLFLGCTGWYNWDANPEYDVREERHQWQNNSNDSRMPVWDAGWPDVLARKHTDWLIEAVSRAQDDDAVERIVILTHTVPKAEFLVGPDHEWYPLNGSYCNSWMSEVPPVDQKKKIKVWAYGHTHQHGDRVQDGIRYVANPRGYAGESSANPFWKPKWIGLD